MIHSKENNSTHQYSLPFWNTSPSTLLQELYSKSEGLTSDEAQQRLANYGPNLLEHRKRSTGLVLFLSQFKSPLILILLFASGLSIFLHDAADALIILVIIFISSFLGFWQELGATHAVEKLLEMVQIKAAVLRDGKSQDINVEEIVPGDIVLLNAGDIVPGDSVILESKDLFVNEATLTGESYPIEKTAGVLAVDTPLAQRINSLWMGTNVVSGSAKVIIVHTGKDTEFGRISEHLKLRPQETEFEHGVKRFGFFLMELTMLLTIVIFAINVYLLRPVIDSLLFSLALAVGLTPQLLPAIITINLAHGARRMANEKVIVKRLTSIENFGSMNIFCSDKTGTLTEGAIRIFSNLDVEGNPSEKVLLYAYLNAFYETGFTNPIDTAILSSNKFDVTEYQKLDEIPYDFSRKRLSIVVSKGGENFLITKGAFPNVLEICSSVEISEGTIRNIATVKSQLQQRFEVLSNQGYRILGVAYKDLDHDSQISKIHESDMTFSGFLVLFDPPKAGIVETMDRLKHFGVSLKIITGDNHLVAVNVIKQIGIQHPKILTGSDLRKMSSEALIKRVGDIDIFAEVEPNQKELIINGLKKNGNVVGYMGDGINDASALHAADVGISVDSSVDVAKESADIVLLEKDLGVLIEGIKEGRRTFANTLKYIFMATSANFGNMFSMAGASLFLSFLPLLPKQILLTNLMTDFPEMTIATDTVDNEMVDRPRRWDIKFIRKFMITFGILSSVFDYVTFGFLIIILSATIDQFRAGWFIESVVSASIIVLVIRSRKPFFKSTPGKYLLITTLFIAMLAIILPFTPLALPFGFKLLSPSFLLVMGMIVLFYIISAEIIKGFFYKRVEMTSFDEDKYHNKSLQQKSLKKKL